jgi:acetyl esterase/lipase
MTDTSTEVVDGQTLLSPEYLAALDVLPNFKFSPELLATIRDQPFQIPFERTGLVLSSDYTVPDTSIVVRVYRPAGSVEPLPAIYSIHGGGYIIGTYEMMDATFERYCPKLGCVGLSVEYRLAPEHPYPAPLDDCYAGLQWAVENHEQLGIDLSSLGIQGTSAGGGLAAALALLVRDRGEIDLAFQVLECPMIDDRFVTPSCQLDRLAVWSRESNEFGWKSYLGDLYGTADVPYTAAAARATDLGGLPPAIVCVGGADGFRDEDIDYALRLSQAGVPTELHVYPGAPHGAQVVADSPQAKQWARDVEDWLRRRFASGGSRGSR